MDGEGQANGTDSRQKGHAVVPRARGLVRWIPVTSLSLQSLLRQDSYLLDLDRPRPDDTSSLKQQLLENR